MTKEIVWRIIPGIEDYAISDDGSMVKKISTGRILKPWDNNGYAMVRITFKNDKAKAKFVHHLSLYADGRPKPPSLVCDHINGKRKDNRPENLEWVTVAENNRRAIARKQAKLAEEGLKELSKGPL
jgi:hypothetical protein